VSIAAARTPARSDVGAEESGIPDCSNGTRDTVRGVTSRVGRVNVISEVELAA